MRSIKSLKKNLRRKILIHASEAGIASFIRSIECDLQNHGYELAYDLHDKAKDILKSRPQGNQEEADLILCGYDRSEIDKTKKFLKQTETLNCKKIGILDTWRGVDRFWYKNGQLRLMTDSLLVPDQITKKYLIERGLPGHYPIVVGNPVLDSAKNPKRKEKNEEFELFIKDRFKLKAEKKLLLFISEPLILSDGSFQSLFSAVGKNNTLIKDWIELNYGEEFELLCRLHPLEVNQIPKNWHNAADLDLEDLICLSDMIVGLASTPIVFSVAMKKVVINLEDILQSWRPEQSDMPSRYWKELKDNGVFNSKEKQKSGNSPKSSCSENILRIIAQNI